jgi:Cleft lip and palate transmembrane protein 1 (CLPTM1)
MHETNFKIGNFEDKRVIDTTITVPKEVQNNGTLWAHYYVAVSGHQLDPNARDYDSAKAYHFFRPLNTYLPKAREVKKKKLIGASKEDLVEDESEQPAPKGKIFASFYHPNFTLSIIPDSGVMGYPSLHPSIRSSTHLEATAARDETGQNGWYYPIVFTNTFWQLRSHMTELNSTVKTLPVHIDLNNMANWKFSIISSVDFGMKEQSRAAASGTQTGMGGDGSEMEMFKSILLDTNIYLLCTTFVVSLLHMLFEMLAFKNDIVGSPFFSPTTRSRSQNSLLPLPPYFGMITRQSFRIIPHTTTFVL